MSTHTPGPWAHNTVTNTVYVKGRIIAKVKDPDIKHMTEEDIVNATFIVRACNAHEELLEALRGLLKEEEGQHSVGCKESAPGYDDSRCCPVRIARQIIAKAVERRTHEKV